MSNDLVKQIERQIVQTDSLFSVDKTFDDPRFMRVRIAAMHSGVNRNNSRFTTDVIKKAESTFANIPVLADVQEYEDEQGNKYLDYSGHSMHIEEDAFDENNVRMIYDEKVVGIVPETNNFEIVHDDETGNDYVYVDALLYRDYGNYVCDILESRDNKTDVSMEIGCDEVSFSAKDKCLDVGIMTACAVTLLGAHVKPGMAKAHAEVFSSTEDDRQTQLINIMQELKNALDDYNKNFGKEEVQVDNEELLEEVTDEVNDEVVEEMSTEEVTEDVTETEETTEEEVTVEEEFSDDTTDDEVAPEEDTNDEETVEESEEVIEEPVVEEPVIEQNCLKYSVECGELKKDFSLSLNEKIYALQELVNETYGELDNDYFMVDVYDEDKLVVFHGWSGKSYRQSFKCKKDKYSLVGDRLPVFAQYLSEDEITALENMRSKYSELETKLSQYEAEPQKMEILNSDDYSQIAETEEFVALKAQDAHFDMSVQELTAKCDEMLLSYAKTQKIDFSAKEQKVVKPMGLPTIKVSEQKKRYGNLFNK